MSPVVSNTTPISNLLRIGQLPLLLQLFGQILIPPQVAAELTAASPSWEPARKLQAREVSRSSR